MRKHSLIRFIASSVLLPIALTAAEEPTVIPLWPDGAPGSEGQTDEETVRVTESGERVVSNVHNPSITAFIPEPGRSTGAAVIIAPGGGHRELWSDHEGYNIAKWLQARGIAGFVLKYRLARGTNSPYTVDEHAFGDMKRAIQLVRSRAEDWNIDPDHVGALGFSAGGELVALAGMRWDEGNKSSNDIVEQQSSKPAFQALIYPGSSRRYEAVEEAPPAFIVAGFGDRTDISEGMVEIYLKYKRAGIPTELHIYSEAEHGFGLRETNTSAVGNWPSRFQEWLADRKLLE